MSDLNQAQRQNLSVVDDAPPTQPQSLPEAPTLQDVQGAEALLLLLAGDRAVHEPSSADEFCAALTAESIAFLEKLRPGGPWVLTAIVPDGRTITANNPKEAQRFIRDHNGRCNLYYSVNPTRGILAKKAAKTDIATIEYVLADLDPAEAEPSADAKARYRAQLETFEPRPTFVIDSGNGIQLLWRLAVPIVLGEPGPGADGTLCYSPKDQAQIDEAEARSAAVMVELSAKAGTQNVDRVLRLPGTINLPNAKKKREGRVVCPTKLIEFQDVSHPLDAFPLPTDGARQQNAKRRSCSDADPPLDLGSLAEVEIAELPISKEIKEAIDTDGTEIGGGDRSRGAARITCELVRANCTDQQIASILWHEPISAHFRGQANPKRAIQRVISWARAEIEEFSLDSNGLPSKSSQHNIRLALRRLGVYVSHDVFQDRLLIEGLPECGPLLDDRAMERLWLTIDEKYRFRPVKDFFWTVVGDEARRHGFHPVVNYLAGLHWDETPRIDKWLSTYAAAKSTPYTDAVGALMLIAAVRRVRNPGCKFDEIVVLESDQGTDKSSALRILAVNDDWFHDDVPLNAEGKRVMEALAGRWIVEAAELNGMRKGEVEHLKAFLSRTHDRARMSYDRYPTEGKRQCVIVGTTNSSSYLRDSTGNRRFWPVTIEQFDTNALRRDRDQLWAEAAAREAQGESIRLDRSLWAAAGGEQALRRIADPWEEIVAEHLDNMEGKLTVEDAWKIVGVDEAHRTQEHNRRLGDAMKKAGWSHGRRRRDGQLRYAYVKGESDRWLRVTRAQQGDLHVRYDDEKDDTAFAQARAHGADA
jgi:hypothetical protein